MAEVPSPTHVVVVAGTATDIGKTWVSAALLTAWRDRGWAVAARKPAQSFDPDDPPETHDSAVLAAASGERDDAVCPPHRRYARALAPPMASDELGAGRIALGDLVAELTSSWPPRRADLGLVELAGGPRSPLAHDGDGVAVTAALRPDSVVLVADAELGTLNAVRLSVGALAGAVGATPLVHLNRFDATSSLHRANLEWLTERDGFAVTTSVDELAGWVADRLPGFCGHCGRAEDECDGTCARPLDPARFCPRCGRRMAVTITPVDSSARCRVHGAV